MVTVNSARQSVQLRASSSETQQFDLRTRRSNDRRSALFHSLLLSLSRQHNKQLATNEIRAVKLTQSLADWLTQFTRWNTMLSHTRDSSPVNWPFAFKSNSELSPGLRFQFSTNWLYYFRGSATSPFCCNNIQLVYAYHIPRCDCESCMLRL